MTFLYKILFKYYANAKGKWKIGIRIILEIIRRILIACGDPAYLAEIRGKSLLLPISHKLPFYISKYPQYDTLPGRVADFLREKDGYLDMMDVGANVGDTILACHSRADDRFLAIEANPSFMNYLRKNSLQIPQVTLMEAFCGSGEEANTSVQIREVGGTARVLESKSGISIPRMSLDRIAAEHQPSGKCNFLKVDTDGNDFDILLSGREFIGQRKPAILFECDIFENAEYYKNFSDVMSLLFSAGYATAIAYDNTGYLFDVFNTGEPEQFEFPLFHQVISEFGYYDILVLRQEHSNEFLKQEMEYFKNHITNPILQSVAERILTRHENTQ
jgi:FkbM family methyltransferase